MKVKRSTHRNCGCEMNGVSREEFLAREAEILERIGHSIRYVSGEYQWKGEEYPSIYTYGLKKNAGHVELECVLPIEPKVAMYLINCIADRVKAGEMFECYEIYQIPELNDVPFYFIPSVQKGSGTPVYRIILADEKRLLPGEEGCHPIYNLQPEIGRDDDLNQQIKQTWNLDDLAC